MYMNSIISFRNGKRQAVQVQNCVGGADAYKFRRQLVEGGQGEGGTLHKNTVLMLRAHYEIVNYRTDSTACLILRRQLEKFHARERIDYDSSSTNL